MSENEDQVLRRLCQLYARIDGPTTEELAGWLDYLQRRFDIGTAEVDALWARAAELGEWADRKVRDVTRIRAGSRG